MERDDGRPSGNWMRPDADAEPLDLTSFPRDGDALIIVPPFASLKRPSLAAHVLQACAAAAGLRVSVLYANFIFAALVGERNYMALCGHDCIDDTANFLLGVERIFAAAAYGAGPVFAGTGDSRFVDLLRRWGGGVEIEQPELERIERVTGRWADAVAAAVADGDFRVVGCTTFYADISASVALLSRVKRLRPEIVTLIGGTSCVGPMAEGIASLSEEVDFVFSGEGEVGFPHFLKGVLTGSRPTARIIDGEPCDALDAIPTVNYDEFFAQRERHIPDSAAARETWLPYESSRGCWWGQKHHCTFCGDKMVTLAYREKSADRVIQDLRTLVDRYRDLHPSGRVYMVDDILPYTYFRTMIPRLPGEVPNVRLFWMPKANLSLAQVVALKRAGFEAIQPGIESLSTSMLRRMKKGVSAAQNIRLLRYVRAARLPVFWNLLYAVPGDRLQEFEEMLALIPLLRHLEPPDLGHVWIHRFSPYFEQPAQYGVSNIRPLEGYARAFPPWADIPNLAYFFVADYRSDSREHPEIVRELSREVNAWREAWRPGGAPRTLAVRRLPARGFVLLDTRGVPGTHKVQIVNDSEARVSLVGGRLGWSPEVEWGLERKVLVELDGRYVPLATAEPGLLMEFEREAAPEPPGELVASLLGAAHETPP